MGWPEQKNFAVDKKKTKLSSHALRRLILAWINFREFGIILANPWKLAFFLNPQKINQREVLSKFLFTMVSLLMVSHVNFHSSKPGDTSSYWHI